MNPFVTPVTQRLHADALHQRQEPRRHAKRLYIQALGIIIGIVSFLVVLALDIVIIPPIPGH